MKFVVNLKSFCLGKTSNESHSSSKLIDFLSLTCRDDDIAKFHEYLEKAKTQCRQHYSVIIMGNFNAQVEEGREGNVIGTPGLGIRNMRGEKLVEWCLPKTLLLET